MISRLTASAALFAILATAGLGFAAEAQQRTAAEAGRHGRVDADDRLPTVDVTGKRLQQTLIALPARCRPRAQRRPKRAFSTAPGLSDRRLPGKPIVCRGA